MNLKSWAIISFHKHEISCIISVAQFDEEREDQFSILKVFYRAHCMNLNLRIKKYSL